MFYSVLTTKCAIGLVFIVNGALQDWRFMYVWTHDKKSTVFRIKCMSVRQSQA